MTVIYALVDPETKLCRYVGKTKGSSANRLRAHISDARRHPRIPRFRWINKLALSGLSPQVIELEETTDQGWQEAEQFWIAYMRAIGSPLLNVTDGGDGIHGHRHSEETKRKMSAAGFRTNADADLKARRGAGVRRAFATEEARSRLSNSLKESHSRPETKERLRASAKRNACTPEARERSRKAHLGKRLSAETKAKISAARKGQKLSPEHKVALRAAHSGARRSEETKARMRAAITPEMRAASAERLRLANINRTPEQRAEISARMKAIWAKRREMS